MSKTNKVWNILLLFRLAQLARGSTKPGLPTSFIFINIFMAIFPCIRMLRTQIRPSVQSLLSSTDDNAHTNIWKLLFWAVRSVNIMQFNFFSMNSFWHWHFVFYLNILVYSKAFSTVTCAQRVCTNVYRRQAFNRRCQKKKINFSVPPLYTPQVNYIDTY